MKGLMLCHHNCLLSMGFPAQKKENSLSGFDGYVNALKKRQQHELNILFNLPVQSSILDNPQKDRNYAYCII